MKLLGLSFAAVLVLIVSFITYSSQVRGPTLTALQRGDQVRIEGRFLGEYSLGFERIRIEDRETGAVICDMSGRTNADIDLAVGANTPQTMFGPASDVTFQAGSGSCQLARGQSYELTAWGNNGSGNVRASSILLQF